jgi:hypothetical protein
MLGSYFRSLLKKLERLVQEASQLLGQKNRAFSYFSELPSLGL